MPGLDEKYKRLKKAAKGALLLGEIQASLIETAREGFEFLKRECIIQPLTCEVKGKAYFSWKKRGGEKLSRPVNERLYLDRFDSEKVRKVLSANVKDISAEELDQVLYTTAMAYCCASDILHTNDKATPGRFFEIMVGHVFASAYNVNPTRLVEVIKLGDGDESGLPTDYTFAVGNKRRIHLPIKTSTRERSIEVWAHQRVLDGVHGVGTFTGVLVCIAETNAKKNFRMTETCVPGQWKLYQKFIARLERVYYLDPPLKYLALSEENRRLINVKPFSRFFAEYGDLT